MSQEINRDEVKYLAAFLIKMDAGNLMDTAPEKLIAEIQSVDDLGEKYLETLDGFQLKRYNAYIAFHNINQPQRKDTNMSDETEVAQATPEVAPEAPATEPVAGTPVEAPAAE